LMTYAVMVKEGEKNEFYSTTTTTTKLPYNNNQMDIITINM
jgi:hypothetical protein